MLECQICGYDFSKSKYPSRSMGAHFRQKHQLSAKEYYLKYISQECVCIICGKEARFVNAVEGFTKYCSSKCAGIGNKETAEKSSIFFL